MKSSWRGKLFLARTEGFAEDSYLILGGGLESPFIIYLNNSSPLFRIYNDNLNASYTVYLGRLRASHLISINDSDNPQSVWIGEWSPPSRVCIWGSILYLTNKNTNYDVNLHYTVYILNDTLPYLIYCKLEPSYRLVTDDLMLLNSPAVGDEPYYPYFTAPSAFGKLIGSSSTPLHLPSSVELDYPFFPDINNLSHLYPKFIIYVGSPQFPFIVFEEEHPYTLLLNVHTLYFVIYQETSLLNLITHELSTKRTSSALNWEVGLQNRYVYVVGKEVLKALSQYGIKTRPLVVSTISYPPFYVYRINSSCFIRTILPHWVLPRVNWCKGQRRVGQSCNSYRFTRALPASRKSPKLLYPFRITTEFINAFEQWIRNVWFDIISFIRILTYHLLRSKYVPLIKSNTLAHNMSIHEFLSAYKKTSQPFYPLVAVRNYLAQFDMAIQRIGHQFILSFTTVFSLLQVQSCPPLNLVSFTNTVVWPKVTIHETTSLVAIGLRELPALSIPFSNLRFVSAQTSRQSNCISLVNQHIWLGALSRERAFIRQSTRYRLYKATFARMIYLVTLASSDSNRRVLNGFPCRWSHWSSSSIFKVKLQRRFIYSRERLKLEIRFLTLNSIRHEYRGLDKHDELRHTFVQKYFNTLPEQLSYDPYPKLEHITISGSGRSIRRNFPWPTTSTGYYSTSTILKLISTSSKKQQVNRILLKRSEKYRHKQKVLGFNVQNSSSYILSKLLEKPDRIQVSKLYSNLNRDLYFPQVRPSYCPYSPIFSHHDLASIRNTFNSLFNLSIEQIRSILRIGMLINRIWLDLRLPSDRKIWILRTLRRHFFQIATRKLPTARFLTSNKGGGISPIWISELQQDENGLLIHLSSIESNILESDSYCSALFSVLWVLRDLKRYPVIPPLASLWSPDALLQRTNRIWLLKEIRINWPNLGFLNDKYNWYGRVGNPNINALAARAFATGVAYRGWSYQYDLFQKYDKRRSKSYWWPRWSYYLHRLNQRVPLWNRSSNIERRNLLKGKQSRRSYRHWFTYRVSLFRLTTFSDYRGSERVYQIKDTYKSHLRNRRVTYGWQEDFRLTIWRYRISPNLNSGHYWEKGYKTESAQIIQTVLLKMCKTSKWSDSWQNNFIRVPGVGLKSFNNWFRPHTKFFWLPSETFYNHILVKVAANRLNRWRHYDYRITDNSVILFDSRVARMYLSILSDLGVKVERTVSDQATESLIVDVARKLFLKGSRWNWRYDHIMKLHQTNPVLAKYWGYKLNHYWRMPRWHYHKVRSEWGPIAGLELKNHGFREWGLGSAALFANQISSTAACLLYTLEVAPRYRENDGLNPFRTHKTPLSLQESILRYTWKRNAWRRILVLDSNDILENPGVKYVVFLERVVNAWLDRMWSQSINDKSTCQQLKTSSFRSRQLRVRLLRRVIKQLPLTTVQLRLRDPDFISQVMSWVEISKRGPILEIPLTSSGQKNWLYGTCSFTLLIREVRTWVSTPPYKSSIERGDFVDYVMLTTLEEVLKTLFKTDRLSVDDLLLLQEISHDLINYSITDQSSVLGGESITIIESY